MAPAVSVAEADATVVAAEVAAATVFPSVLGFDDAAPPFPPFPLVPFGGDDRRDEEEFAVKYLYLFPFPSPPPPDLEEKNENARMCCRDAWVVVDVEVVAAVEARETVGRVATSRANICGDPGGEKEKGRQTVWLPPSDSLTSFQKRNESRGHRCNAGTKRQPGTVISVV